MDGITDAVMRDYLGGVMPFSYGVTEFIRVSTHALPTRVFVRDVPELASGAKTRSGMPVQVQLLGGDPERMAQSAQSALKAGASAIDINFGCPAPTVNRNDGGASLLRHPCRIRELVAAVRNALPPDVPVSAKLRLGWDSTDDIIENAAMVEEAGASWITIHARTRMQGYSPPVYWEPVAQVRENLSIPVIANGDLWTMEDFDRCRSITGCFHFMLGRSALADPTLVQRICANLGLGNPPTTAVAWSERFRQFVAYLEVNHPNYPVGLTRLKQWGSLAHRFGDFEGFDRAKRAETVEEFLDQAE